MVLIAMLYSLFGWVCFDDHSRLHNTIVTIYFLVQQIFHFRTIVSDPGLAVRDRVEFEEPLNEEQAL